MTNHQRLLRLLQLVVFLNNLKCIISCEKEIHEDICPQREGIDRDCEKRCQQDYPLRISSSCHLRNTGTLLSFFGIRSFVCKCHLPAHFCDSTESLAYKNAFSLDALNTYSSLKKMTANMQCHVLDYESKLSCRDQFESANCGWQRSYGADWFIAKATHEMPFAIDESPLGNYLVAVGHQSTPIIELSTCHGLCSKNSVNISARIWRAPWVSAELCFRENDAIMCAPLRTSNGGWVNEVIPQTDHFQISFKFSNFSEKDVVLLDDVMVKFESCSQPKGDRNDQSVERTETNSISGENELRTVSGPLRILSANTHHVVRKYFDSKNTLEVRPHKDAEVLKRRFCKEGECTTLVHQPVQLLQNNIKKTCIGRSGILKCREKCKTENDDGISARCIRQKEYPFTKVCICQMRRSAIHLVDGDRNTAPHPKKGITEESAEKQVEQSVEIRPTSVNSEKQQEAVQLSSTPINILPLRNTEENNAIQKFPKLWQDKVDSTVCRDDGTNIECDKQCKRIDPLSYGFCSKSNSLSVCSCSPCVSILCNFEKDNECGWTDLHLVSTRFGNISIAAKKGQDNRYGLSRISGKSYSGLSRTGILNGPISLSLDVYTSDVTEVRICVDSLQKCQAQIVTPRSWNRVTAKIKVSHTDKVFLLFYNSATQEKTIAVDNISLLSGDC